MKILLINNEFPPIGSGGSTVTLYAARELTRTGHEVHLITSSYKDLPRYEVKDGYHIHRVPSVRKRPDYCSAWELSIFTLSASVFALRFARKFRPDIVQAYFAVPAGGIAYLLKKVCGIPYCIFLGGSDVPYANKVRFRLLYPFLAPMIRLFWRNASAVVAPSKGLIERAKACDLKQEFILIPNGVDLKQFCHSSRRHSGPVRILTVGRLIKRKGFQYLIAAIPKVLRRAKGDFVIELVGSGPYEDDLRKLVEGLGVGGLVEFSGLVPYENLPKFYQRADIFVLPSLSEGMPLVLLEAIASGLPAVVSRVEGNEELVRHKRNGFALSLEEIQSPESFANALLRLVEDGDLRRGMGRESTAISRRFDWRNIVREYEGIYEDIISSKRDA